MKTRLLCGLVVIALFACERTAGASQFDDLTQWTQVEDPPHTGMSVGLLLDAHIDGTVDSEAFLTAKGAVPAGVDIGLASVDGGTVASSSYGFYFDPGADFTLAIDYQLIANESVGLAGIGFGIGESRGGENSAGIAVSIANGAPVAAAAAARIGDVDQTPLLASNSPPTEGVLWVTYESATQDVLLGVSEQGPAQPIMQRRVSGVIPQWSGAPLLASFFLRSEGLVSGELTAVFTDPRVLDGAVLNVPEPTSAILAALALVVASSRRHARG